MAVLSACSSPGSTPAATAPGAGTSAGVALATSFATQEKAWAVVAMGHLDDPVNTFWQLLVRPTGSSGWQLATPPGVASNGGLVASFTSPAMVTAGFEPSIDLHFSPLAQQSDPAAAWSPGVLPGRLAFAPDALAASSAHRYLALLGAGGSRVVASTGDLSTWSTVASIRGLAGAPAASACGITALTAVAFGDGGADLVGTACARGSRAGIFESEGGSWQAVGPALPGLPGPTRVLRLVDTPAGVSALVDSGPIGSRTLYALFSEDGSRTWTVSAALHLDRAPVTSTGVTPAGGLIVTTGGGAGERSASVVGPSGGGWQPLPAPPAGTSAVAAGPGGSFEALMADRSTLAVYLLGAGGWHRVQSLAVAIQYGSSG